MKRVAHVSGSLVALWSGASACRTAPGTASADQGVGTVPDIALSIAVRQKYDGRIDPGVHLLPKPFTAEALGTKLRTVLHQRTMSGA